MLPIQAQIYGMRLAGFDQPTLARVGECNRKHADGNSRISIRIPKDTQLMLLKTWRKTIGREPSSSFIENNPSHQINKNPVAATMSAANHSKAHIPDVVPLFEEPSPYSATGYCGQFFRTDQRKIIGWIASDSALEQNADALKVRIIGLDTLLCSVKPISAFDVDIECAFEKKFFFEVDIGEANEISVINNTHIAVLYRVNMHHTPSVSSEEKLLASKIRRLTGEVFNAAHAVKLGLIHEAVEHEALDHHIEHIVSTLLKGGPMALRESKELIALVSHTDRSSNHTISRRTAEVIAQIRVSPEGQEGLGAFLEKRKPSWEH